MTHALICGGGIGGLSAAIALLQQGMTVTVFEKSDSLRATGAGLNLWPNAGRALYSLGLQREYLEHAAPLQRYITMLSNGKVLHDRDVHDWNRRYGAPATGIYRWNLLSMLAEAVQKNGKIEYSRNVVSVEQTADKVTATFVDGETRHGDILIGADGIHSSVRKTLFGTSDYHNNEHHSDRWRGIVRTKDVSFDTEAETEVFGDGSFFGSIPTGNGYAYWFASGPNISTYEQFVARYSAWTATHVPATIQATPMDKILRTPLYDLTDLPPKWSHGRITLLGDAAHPMMPDMAQGASQTLVDSAALGQSLASSSDLVTGLEDYEKSRRSDAYKVVYGSRRGMFLEGTTEKRGEDIDPVSVRYERDVEGELV